MMGNLDLNEIIAVLDAVGDIEGEIDKQTYDQYRDLTARGDMDAPGDADLFITIPVKTDRAWAKTFARADKLRTILLSTPTTSGDK